MSKIWENGIVTTSQNDLETLSFKVSKVSHEWSRYGLAEANLVFGSEGNFRESPYKAICKMNGKADPIAIVSQDYTLLPNEFVKEKADSITPNYGLSLYETEGMTQSHYSKTGNAMFLYYFPKDEHNGSAFEKQIVPGDNIKLGIHVRNSIDGTTGLGVDSFSYRGLCGNGSIQQRKDAINFYHKHTQGLKEIIPTLKNLIENALAEGEYTVMYYRKLAGITLSQEIADAISSTYIPKKYLPWDMSEIKTTLPNGEVTTSEIANLKTLSLNNNWTRQDITHLTDSNMWSVYNHMTGAIWNNDKTNPQSKALVFSALSSVMQSKIPLVVR
jgi:hypothetical protein